MSDERKTRQTDIKRTRPKRDIVVTAQSVNVQTYNSVVATARLADLSLISFHSEFKLDPFNNEIPAFDLQVSDNMSDWGLNAEDSYVWCEISFVAECVIGNKKPIKIKCAYSVRYTFRGVAEEETAKLFLERVAKFACYPYFRALVSTTAGQANIALPPLPVLREPPRKLAPTQPAKTISKARPKASQRSSEG